ncbi:hypothetical protein GCM10023322_69430 [Rugosimonospora acidiphila]|uniref:Peptidase inhibitor family I36 n=1 Tax=Rugosimonospora acidiphila TaxID=556531 RepID=A0ABP9SM77_9ACTN
MNISPITRRSVAAAAMAGGLAVAGLSIASPASAATATPSSVVLPSCPDSYVCFYPFKNFGGHQGKVKDNNPDFSKMPHTTSECHTGTWNDCIESVDNQGLLCTVYFFVDASYRGAWHSLAVNNDVSDFGIGFHDSSFNDKISSNSWCTSKPLG